MTNEKEFIEYVKSKVKINKQRDAECDTLCQYLDTKLNWCELFRCRMFHIDTIHLRCDDCKKYFND
jgi:hypothetical protein